MKMKVFLNGIPALLMLLPAVEAFAHHSRANFLLDETVTFEATVTKYTWKNPHVYIELEASGELWLVEAHSLTGLKRLGWDSSSLKSGDQVLITGNPDKDPARHFLLLDHFVKDNGNILYSFRRPRKDNNEPLPVVEPSKDFSGTWTRVSSLRQSLLVNFTPPDELPLTEFGYQSVAGFNSDDDPIFNCISIGMPRIIFQPYLFRWTRYADRIEIEKEHSDLERTIYLVANKHPENIKPSVNGHSIARFEENGSLFVDTVGFEPAVWGNSVGLDSSEEKHVTERYTLTDDGLGMDVSYTVSDPVYLKEPITVTGRYRKVADQELVPYKCDLETARRHLSVE